MPEQTTSVIACNPQAISERERSLYRTLSLQLQAAIVERHELADGYEFSLDENSISFTDAAKWVDMERRCCPFLILELHVSGTGNCLLKLLGPEGTNAIIEHEFLKEY
jgi:hypothetical protein